MKIDIVTIFPEYFGPLELSLIGRARQAGLLEIDVHDLRTWTHDVHRTVDDTPYGGGPGMVMRPEPWGEALDALASAGTHVVVPTPAGRLFSQELAHELAAEQHLIFACGRYEGIDQRVLDHTEATEVSIGDYVLFGGEVAVLVIVEALTRLLPGVLGNADSVTDDSFAAGAMSGLLEGPVYTKPADWDGIAVPPVLQSGNHGAIARWRRDQALRRTAANRPDLIAGLDPNELDDRDREVLAEAGRDLENGGHGGGAAPR